MSVELSPKKQFMTLQQDSAVKFADLISDPAIRTALTYAFAQLGHGGVTPEELNGAKKFIAIFSTLAERPESDRLPKRNLKTY